MVRPTQPDMIIEAYKHKVLKLLYKPANENFNDWKCKYEVEGKMRYMCLLRQNIRENQTTKI